jgi:putative transposase
MEKENNYLVDIISYCYMPNHWHLLLKQNIDRGITIYINRLSNSYARYFNTKYGRKGPIFQGRFKSVVIENDKQLLHTSRYIHLNPYSSNVISSINELENYQFSSFQEYTSMVGSRICEKEIILNNFKKINSYKNFVFDHAGYQRKIEKYKHLFIE